MWLMIPGSADMKQELPQEFDYAREAQLGLFFDDDGESMPVPESMPLI